ncbi:regulatory protein RecX [Pectinatus haikarae]|uniref:regulatory protein RecX n=1 Tax=Pectinatus haikarae TaxID=349096 RepID=UPI0018C4CF74|nr:regulatory protein RecX [Pectinatus haikarae]
MQTRNSKSALAKAIDYLSVQDYSVNRIVDKLFRCGYEQQEIDAAVARLIEKRYLDDEQLCIRYWSRYLAEKKYSVLQIKAKLKMKGFSANVIDRCTPQELSDYEKITAYSIWQRYMKKNKDIDKFMQYLYRKGFSMSSIRYAADESANSELIQSN